jgi:hypothetical protein
MVISMSAHQGTPPLMGCFEWSIDRACEVGNSYTLPDSMRYHLILLRFCDRVTKIMSDNNASPLGMPPDSERVLLMNVLEEDLNTLEAQFDGKLSRESLLLLGISHLLIAENLMSSTSSKLVSTCGYSTSLTQPTSSTEEAVS